MNSLLKNKKFYAQNKFMNGRKLEEVKFQTKSRLRDKIQIIYKLYNKNEG